MKKRKLHTVSNLTVDFLKPNWTPSKFIIEKCINKIHTAVYNWKKVCEFLFQSNTAYLIQQHPIKKRKILDTVIIL